MFRRIRSKLANTITFFISLILISVLGLVGVFSFDFIYNQTVDNVRAKMELKAESISKDVRNIFENANIVTEQMALHPEIRAYLKTAVDKNTIRDNPYFQDVLRTLIDIQASNEIHYLAWVANEKANFYLDSLGIIPDETYDVKKRPWYDVAVKTDGVAFTPPYVEWATRRVVISSIKALRENGSIYGFVVVDIVLDNVPFIFERAKLGENDRSFLISKDGTYVYHSDPEKIMEKKISDADDSLSPYVEDINNAEGTFVDISYEGKDYFLMSYLVDDRGWKVVTLIDKQGMKNQVQQIAWIVTTAFVLALGVSIGSVYYTVKRATKPYVVLVDYAKEITNGELSKNIPEYYLIREDEMGEISKAFQIIIDTFRNEHDIMEQRIVEKNKELETQYKYILETEKAASLGNLVAGIAHEINTPIGISLSSASYLDRVNDESRKKLAAGTMTKNDLMDFMETLTDSLVLLNNNLARAGEMIKSFKQVAVDQSSELRNVFDLKENISVVILSLRHEYKRTHHKINNNCPDDIRVDSYPGAFSQIFTNLIMNSIKHGFKDVYSGEINIDAERTDNTLRIVYKDNGKGMTEETLTHLYEPFYTTNRADGNSGLGMHIVFNLVNQKLKGNIRCESNVNEGVKFIIEIPV